MTDEAQTWHYGLVARWWAELNTDGPEIAYFKGLIERYGQPALEVACGTGRRPRPGQLRGVRGRVAVLAQGGEAEAPRAMAAGRRAQARRERRGDRAPDPAGGVRSPHPGRRPGDPRVALAWRDGQVIRQEENVLLERRYFRDELVAMLALAGFADVQVLGDYTDEVASPDSDVLVSIATKA